MKPSILNYIKNVAVLMLIVILFFAGFSTPSVVAQSSAGSVYMEVDDKPVPAGGLEGWTAYLAENLNYPEAARESQTEGIVVATFVLLKNGELSNVEILRGIDKGCDEEVIRRVKESPK